MSVEAFNAAERELARATAEVHSDLPRAGVHARDAWNLSCEATEAPLAVLGELRHRILTFVFVEWYPLAADELAVIRDDAAREEWRAKLVVVLRNTLHEYEREVLGGRFPLDRLDELRLAVWEMVDDLEAVRGAGIA